MKLTTWRLYWSPEGRCIATVQAMTRRSAVRKAPMPYRRFLGELYAESAEEFNPDIRPSGTHSA